MSIVSIPVRFHQPIREIANNFFTFFVLVGLIFSVGSVIANWGMDLFKEEIYVSQVGIGVDSDTLSSGYAICSDLARGLTKEDVLRNTVDVPIWIIQKQIAYIDTLCPNV